MPRALFHDDTFPHLIGIVDLTHIFGWGVKQCCFTAVNMCLDINHASRHINVINNAFFMAIVGRLIHHLILDLLKFAKS